MATKEAKAVVYQRTLFGSKKVRKKSNRNEEKLQSSVCKWMRLQYRYTLFLADLAAGCNLGPKWNGLKSAWRTCEGMPDLYIYERRGEYGGLFIELKTTKGSPLLQNGKGIKAGEHLQKQNDVHIMFRNKGYLAMFCVGFDHTRAVIDWYMGGAIGEPPKYEAQRKRFATEE